MDDIEEIPLLTILSCAITIAVAGVYTKYTHMYMYIHMYIYIHVALMKLMLGLCH